MASSRSLRVTAITENLSEIYAVQTSYLCSVTCNSCTHNPGFLISAGPGCSTHTCPSCRRAVDIKINQIVTQLHSGQPADWVKVESSAVRISNIKLDSNSWMAWTVQHDAPRIDFGLDQSLRYKAKHRGMKVSVRLECTLV